MTTTTPDPITPNQQRVLVRQTVTGFEQGIAAVAGLCTAGPLGAIASWGVIRGVQGKWTPWVISGVIGAPLAIGLQVGVVSAINEATQNNRSDRYEQVTQAPQAPQAPTYEAPQVPQTPKFEQTTQESYQTNQNTNVASGPLCEFPNSDLSRQELFSCDVTSRTNANGHTVFDVEAGGLKTTVVLWDDGSAEYFQEGNRFNGYHFDVADGQTRVTDVDGSYTFVF